jgi:hypothetical protein
VKEFGKLDIVVANAGIQAYGPLANSSEEDWNNVIDINVKGTANMLRAALPHMLSRKYGRIVVISSGQGRHGFKNGSGYSASKWGLIRLDEVRGLGGGERWNHSELRRARIGRHTIDAKSGSLERVNSHCWQGSAGESN